MREKVKVPLHRAAVFCLFHFGGGTAQHAPIERSPHKIAKKMRVQCVQKQGLSVVLS